jgi:hypothetical protein
VGPEIDRVDLAHPPPRPVEILLHSPFTCPLGQRSAADTTYYTTASGAGVFDAGTMSWVCALGAACAVPPETQRFVQVVTDNLLHAFAAGPAGAAHPARDNVNAVLGTR